MNIKLLYLYRDAGNYKQCGEVVYTNKNKLAVEYIRDFLRSRLIYGLWFFVSDWHLKDLHHYPFDLEIDHDYHEFDDVEETEEQPTNGDIQELISSLLSEAIS